MRNWPRINPLAGAGMVVLLTIALVAIFSPLVAPYDPGMPDLRARLSPPAWTAEGSWAHILGTDHLGRDILSRLIFGSRIALTVGFGGVCIAGTIGVFVGLVSGYFGGKTDAFLMAVVNTLLAIPNILLYLTVLAVFSQSIILLIVVIGCINWTAFARVVRSEVMSLRSRAFIENSTIIGQRVPVMLFRHMLPNVFGSVIVIATLNVATIIILEAALSFLGFGVQAPTVTWGGMLADGRDYVATAWWLACFPGVTITLLTLSLIFIGDWLRDVLDPRSNG
ncbi:ABC transporter permease [Neptunicoccus cionae]|uniref:ABC transporter permease n=1 Tax=Neptunicoccus cionae TaxID=2035344 RepID=UPI001C60B06C|nr:ABC transporter permease [Amylibacter cionae]